MMVLYDAHMYHPYCSSTKTAESPAASLDTNEEEVTPSEVGSHPPRPATPPTKDQAFEEFKKQRGSEINKILLDNKGISKDYVLSLLYIYILYIPTVNICIANVLYMFMHNNDNNVVFFLSNFHVAELLCVMYNVIF